jgi:hypothetical protein
MGRVVCPKVRIVRPMGRVVCPKGRIVHRSGRIAHGSQATLHGKRSATPKPRQKNPIRPETTRVLQGLGHAALVPGYTFLRIPRAGKDAGAPSRSTHRVWVKSDA